VLLHVDQLLQSGGMGSLCGCCRWCLLLLAEWCEGFYGVRRFEAVAATLGFRPFLLVGYGKCYLFSIKCTSRSFGCMSLDFIARGYGLAAPSARLPRATLLALLADLVWLIRICWVSFTAWLLSRNGYDCIWLTIFLSLLSFRLEVWSQVGITYLCLL
jgi:hypothetical protein